MRMSKSRKVSHLALEKWAKLTLSAKPEIDDDTAKIEFSFKAGGHYPL